mmetsp:Transcript_10112/g.43987  ORF Transcript_10112/g.43987 Transcript_10112/m.43987 type:complete len:348 (-) Transcript_10112:3263-4306(-)
MKRLRAEAEDHEVNRRHPPAFVGDVVLGLNVIQCVDLLEVRAPERGDRRAVSGRVRAGAPAALKLRRNHRLDRKRHRVDEVGPLPVHRDLRERQVEAAEKERNGDERARPSLRGLDRGAHARHHLPKRQKRVRNQDVDEHVEEEGTRGGDHPHEEIQGQRGDERYEHHPREFHDGVRDGVRDAVVHEAGPFPKGHRPLANSHRHDSVHADDACEDGGHEHHRDHRLHAALVARVQVEVNDAEEDVQHEEDADATAVVRHVAEVRPVRADEDGPQLRAKRSRVRGGEREHLLAWGGHRHLIHELTRGAARGGRLEQPLQLRAVQKLRGRLSLVRPFLRLARVGAAEDV